MAWEDAAIRPWTEPFPAAMKYAAAAVGAAVVVIWGKLLARRAASSPKEAEAIPPARD